jgi:hypothetical protein
LQTKKAADNQKYLNERPVSVEDVGQSLKIIWNFSIGGLNFTDYCVFCFRKKYSRKAGNRLLNLFHGSAIDDRVRVMAIKNRQKILMYSNRSYF